METQSFNLFVFFVLDLSADRISCSICEVVLYFIPPRSRNVLTSCSKLVIMTRSCINCTNKQTNSNSKLRLSSWTKIKGGLVLLGPDSIASSWTDFWQTFNPLAFSCSNFCKCVKQLKTKSIIFSTHKVLKVLLNCITMISLKCICYNYNKYKHYDLKDVNLNVWTWGFLNTFFSLQFLNTKPTQLSEIFGPVYWSRTYY